MILKVTKFKIVGDIAPLGYVEDDIESILLNKKKIKLLENLENKIYNEALNKNNVTHTINRIGSMISVHFSEDAVIDFDSAAKGNNDTFKAFFHGMLKKGIYIAPSAFESWFITDELTYQDLNETISAVEDIAKDL